MYSVGIVVCLLLTWTAGMLLVAIVPVGHTESLCRWKNNAMRLCENKEENLAGYSVQGNQQGKDGRSECTDPINCI